MAVPGSSVSVTPRYTYMPWWAQSRNVQGGIRKNRVHLPTLAVGSHVLGEVERTAPGINYWIKMAEPPTVLVDVHRQPSRRLFIAGRA